MKNLVIVLTLVVGQKLWAAHADLHAHIASHIPYGIMLFGGTPEAEIPEDLTHDHAIHQHMHIENMKDQGPALIVQAALVNALVLNKKKARAQIMSQFDYIEALVAKHPQDFVLAKSPAEAKKGLAENKVVFVLAIEGAEGVVDTLEEAMEYRKRGVAMVGPIHLIDDIYGDASIMKGTRALLNWKGVIKSWFGLRKGLTELGKTAVNNLVQSGIIVDMAHVSEKSFDGIMEILDKNQVPGIVSHSYLREVRNDERGLTEAQVRRLSAGGGMIGIIGGATMLHPYEDEIKSAGLLDKHCKYTYDDFILHSKKFDSYFREGVTPAFTIGSDFNGFVSHFRPRNKQEGCSPLEELKDLAVEEQGLVHPGMMNEVWKAVEKRGHSTEKINRSAETFIAIWAKARSRSSGMY